MKKKRNEQEEKMKTDSGTRCGKERTQTTASFPVALPLSLLLEPAGMASNKIATNPSTPAQVLILSEPTQMNSIAKTTVESPVLEEKSYRFVRQGADPH